MCLGPIYPSEGKRIPRSIKSFVLSGMFSVGAADSVIVRQTPDMRLRSVKGESDAR